MNAQEKILKKLSVSILAGSSTESYTYTDSPVSLSFIFGLGTAGLSPFEISLGEIEIGNSFDVQLDSSELQPYFGPLFTPLREALSLLIIPDQIFFHFELTEIAETESREVVTALAGMQKHGSCSGDCDCGCS